MSKNQEILGGVPVIEGTRIPATLVFDLLKRGYSVSLIRKEYPSLTTRKLSAFLSLRSSAFDGSIQSSV